MATARDAAPERTQYWVVPVVRGLLALVPAAVITFSPNHSPELGLLVFGVWAIASGLVVGALSLRLLADRGIRSLFARERGRHRGRRTARGHACPAGCRSCCTS